MKAFTIDGDNGIPIYGSRKDAVEAADKRKGADVFATEDQLAGALAEKTTADLVEIFNAFTGVREVTKFTSRAVAVGRIWRECLKMQVEVKPVDREIEVEVPVQELKTAKAKAPLAPKAASAPTAGSGPREGGKLAIVLDMIRRPEGATLEEIMKSQDWQIHTTRALMSAGGAYAKKYGIVVISENVGDKRTYRVGA
jgi:hypothetical protein